MDKNTKDNFTDKFFKNLQGFIAIILSVGLIFVVVEDERYRQPFYIYTTNYLWLQAMKEKVKHKDNKDSKEQKSIN